MSDKYLTVEELREYLKNYPQDSLIIINTGCNFSYESPILKSDIYLAENEKTGIKTVHIDSENFLEIANNG